MLTEISRSPASITRQSEIVEGADHLASVWTALIRLRDEANSEISNSSREISTIKTYIGLEIDEHNSIFALADHTHSQYSSVNHTHSQYAAASHSHGYLPLSGGTVSGLVNIHSITITQGSPHIWTRPGSLGRNVLTLGTEGYGHAWLAHEPANATYTGGIWYNPRLSATMSNVAGGSQVGSSRHIKDAIDPLDEEKVAAAVKNISPVSFQYKEDTEAVTEDKKYNMDGSRRTHLGFHRRRFRRSGHTRG